MGMVPCTSNQAIICTSLSPSSQQAMCIYIWFLAPATKQLSAHLSPPAANRQCAYIYGSLHPQPSNYLHISLPQQPTGNVHIYMVPCTRNQAIICTSLSPSSQQAMCIYIWFLAPATKQLSAHLSPPAANRQCAYIYCSLHQQP